MHYIKIVRLKEGREMMTVDETVALLRLANNGVTLSDSLTTPQREAVDNLVRLGMAEKTTTYMYKYGAVDAYRLKETF
jgi:hypothetical protein